MPTIEPSYRSYVRSRYNSSEHIWDASDRWHAWARRQIEAQMELVAVEFKADAGPNGLVVDVGSGGDGYALAPALRVDVDLAETRLARSRLPVCGLAESLPLRSGIADLTVCVGSVLNYTSLEEAVSELTRITKPGGRVVIQLELSNAFEFIGTRAYREDVAFVPTFYRGDERLWVYSNSYVRRTLAANSLAVSRTKYFHIFSSLLLKITRRPDFAARIAPLDYPLANVGAAGNFADSGIYVCSRTA